MTSLMKQPPDAQHMAALFRLEISSLILFYCVRMKTTYSMLLAGSLFSFHFNQLLF